MSCMYRDILFPVSFYLLDQTDLKEHGEAVASSFDAKVHLLSLTLKDEGRMDIEEHREAFLDFAAYLEDKGVEVTTELRSEPVQYNEVSEVIVDEASDYDLILMGHTKVNRERSGDDLPTADRVINTSPIPVLVIPLGAPRFRDVY